MCRRSSKAGEQKKINDMKDWSVKGKEKFKKQRCKRNDDNYKTNTDAV